MKINPRPAEIGDYGSFISMWEEFLKEREAHGSIVPCSEPLLAQATDLFYRIVFHRTPGVCILVPKKGVCLWGPELPFPTKLGRTLIAQGTYVRSAFRGHKIAQVIFAEALQAAHSLGFDAVLSSVDTGNETSTRVASRYPFIDAQLSKLIPTGGN